MKTEFFIVSEDSCDLPLPFTRPSMSSLDIRTGCRQEGDDLFGSAMRYSIGVLIGSGLEDRCEYGLLRGARSRQLYGALGNQPGYADVNNADVVVARIHADPAFAAKVGAQLGADGAGDRAT